MTKYKDINEVRQVGVQFPEVINIFLYLKPVKMAQMVKRNERK